MLKHKLIIKYEDDTDFEGGNKMDFYGNDRGKTNTDGNQNYDNGGYQNNNYNDPGLRDYESEEPK